MKGSSLGGLLITFEGPDGSGKTTQLTAICERLEKLGIDFVRYREPGGTNIGEQVRNVVHDRKNSEMAFRTEVLLYQAARAQVVEEKIKPALVSGKLVFLDRFRDSSLAYQGFGRGFDIEKIHDLNEFSTDGLMPDVTVYVDISAEEGLRRRKADKGAEWNRLDAEAIEFHQRVREGYRQLVATDPDRFILINGERGIDEITADIWKTLEGRLIQAGFLERPSTSRERGS